MVYRSTEYDVAQWLYKKYGGDIKLLNEAVDDGVKMADYLWRGKYWELKSTTTEKAANSAVRKAMQQIKENPGGIILNYTNDINIQKTIDVIEKRMNCTKKDENTIDIMIVQNGETKIILRY